MTRKSITARNRDQTLRQQKLRDEARKARRPNRDDLARMVLWQLFHQGLRRGKKGQQMLDIVYDRACSGLVQQGFAEREVEVLWDGLVARYRSGEWPFRQKRHLTTDEDGS